jgi:hypothetical protein
MRKIALIAVVAFAAACGSNSTPTGYFRVANLAPDNAVVDFCVRTNGTTSWGSPVMAGLGEAGGLIYNGGSGIEGAFQVSRYIGYTPGAYDILVFNKTSGTTCATTPIATLLNVSIADGGYKLIALTGNAAVAHTLVPFVDHTSVSAGNVAIRFINAGFSPGGATSAGPISVYVSTATITNQPVLLDIPYPGKAPASTVPPVDADGYAVVAAAAFSGIATLKICPAGEDPATYPYCATTEIPEKTITANTIATAFTIGDPMGTPTALLCGDNASTPYAGWNYSMCQTKPALR